MPYNEHGHIKKAIENVEADQAREPHDANQLALLRLRQASDILGERDRDLAERKAREAAAPKP